MTTFTPSYGVEPAAVALLLLPWLVVMVNGVEDDEDPLVL
jgi:hypothetical protein